MGASSVGENSFQVWRFFMLAFYELFDRKKREATAKLFLRKLFVFFFLKTKL